MNNRFLALASLLFLGACGSDTSQLGMLASAPSCDEVQSSFLLAIDSKLNQMQSLLHVRPDATIEIRNETLMPQEFYFGCESDPYLKGRRLDPGESISISLMDHLREAACEVYVNYGGISRTVQIQIANACR